MSKKWLIDFDALIDEVCQEGWGRDQISIWCGSCNEDDLFDFLLSWNLVDMRYRIWESSSEVVFQKDLLPSSSILLERGRLFGNGGDLTLRRYRKSFHWHFIGPAGIQPPNGDYGSQDYWEKDGKRDCTFHKNDEKVLLWGERKEGQNRWIDDRVGSAILHYPAPSYWRKIQLKYAAFGRAEKIEFIWLQSLEVYNG
jgi:hypothetical protein